MIINRTNLGNLNTGFKATFNGAFGAVSNEYTNVTTVVNSSTLIETYAWLAKMPGMREWIGDRFRKMLETEAYTLKNRKFEDTVEVPREALEDDQYSIFSPMLSMMGESAAQNPEKLIFTEAFPGGFTTNCYDGQFFFDTDHPVRVNEVTEKSVSNFQGGVGTPWYLLCTKKPMKPFIYQDRIKAELIIHDDPMKSDDVFNRDVFTYGTRARGAAGHGFWQLAYASKEDLIADTFESAYFKMMECQGDGAQPLGIVPDTLVVPPSLVPAAEKILERKELAGAGTNTNYKRVKILASPWLV